MSPMATFGLCAPDGQSTERQRAYYEARARAGVGLIKVEATVVHPSGRSFSPSLDDRRRPIRAGPGSSGGRRRSGTGARSSSSSTTAAARAPRPSPGDRPWRPPRCLARVTPRCRARCRAPRSTRSWRRSAGARRGRAPPASTASSSRWAPPISCSGSSRRRRTADEDEYGGDLPRRMRMILEVVARIRRAVGPQCLVGARLPMLEFEEDGLQLPEALQAARMLEQAGLDFTPRRRLRR